MSNSRQSQTQKIQSQQPLYRLPEGAYDEAITDAGQVRDHWTPLLNSFRSLGDDNLTQRHIKSQRILRDDGATYKPYTEEEHTWQLDPVPLLLDSETWQSMESGLLQRTELFNRMLIDIYGEQQLIRQGVLPPDAIFAHPGFLRPCFGIKPPSEHALIIHGIDMARSHDNQWCIIGDRTQSPSGAGYALENRTVMNRVFSSLFRETQVRRLALFFQSLRHKLNSFGSEGELPNIVVLTPGSRSESYFEHAYLANYLGYALVQGRDLVVRNGYVWTKSLSGLSRVDVIVRRVDDFYCDPAELKSDSYLGVPGLLEVIRAGRVVVANPLGSGILENPVLLKYLPSISQLLLGEELMLPSVQTWWAYDAQDREFILDNLSELIIKPAAKRVGEHSIPGHQLTLAEQDELRQKILAQPMKYVAQTYVNPSSSPCWQGEFMPRPAILRGFVVAGESRYAVMPGGLTRVGNSMDDRVITNQRSALSKDTWVLADEPEKYVSLWSDHQGHIATADEQQQNLPSRVVENMFWLGRYATRAEYALRLLRTVFVQLNSVHQLSEKSYHTILLAVTQVTETYPGFSAPDSLLFDNPEPELLSLVIDSGRMGSVAASLREMLKSADEIKVLLSADTQRVINDIRDNVSVLETAIRNDFASAPEEALDPLVTSLLALSGLVHESMIRGYGWRFMEIGRGLERSYQTLSLLRALLVPKLPEYDEDSVLETVLLTLETLITYRRRYRARTDVINGLELTLLDDGNPRSLNYILQGLKNHIDALPQRPRTTLLSREGRLILELLNRIQLAQPEQLGVTSATDVDREALDNLLTDAQELINQLSQSLSDTYFEHMETHKDVMGTQWEDEL